MHQNANGSSGLKSKFAFEKKCNKIQSSNILVSDCGRSVVLADFGLSMRLSSEMYSSSQSIGQAGNLISIRASSSLCFRNKSLHEP
jgi:serine/threonine protein kinase